MTGQEARDEEREALIREARSWPRDGVNEGALINALADEIERLATRKHSEPEITDAFRAYVDRLGVDANEEHDGDEWWSGYRQAQRDNILRATAALRVPVGEGEQ